jgi:hypothetical protein
VSYTVTSTHVESLHDGRTVEPGDSLSDADAKRNQTLIDRGVLVKDAERRKPSAKTEPSQKAEQEAAAAPQEKEESK